MIAVTRSVVELAQAASNPPADWGDPAQVERYLTAAAPKAAALIAAVVDAVRAGRLGVIGDDAAAREEIERELELAGATALNPLVIELIVKAVLALIAALAKKE